MQNLTGKKLGQYEILRELGHGGMADVYLARQEMIGREVAIKVLPAYFLQDRTFLERFNREVQIIARLQHPRILPVIDFGEHENMPYIVMAYMSGGSLTDLIRESGGGLPLDRTSRLMTQIAEGLEYAHEKGIIHRDFKPSNVLLDEKGNAHLADFGIAKITADTAQLTGSGLVGTPAYMAPEMSRSGGVTPLIDVYAMGVTLFQMITGRQPFNADTPIGIMMAHATEPVPDIASHRTGLPAEIQPVIDRSMAKDPAARYQTPGDMAADLANAITGEISAAPAKTTSPTPEKPAVMAMAMSDEGQAMTMPVPTPSPQKTSVIKKKSGGGVRIAAIGFGALVIIALGIVVMNLLQGGGEKGSQGTQTGENAAPPHNAATASALGALPGRIYFASDRDGDFEIFSVRPDGTGLTQLTFNDSTDNYPDVSSDGQIVLFITDREEQFSDQLYIMAPDGSGQARIRDGQVTYGETPRYSPVGTKVAFSSYDNTLDLIVVQLLELDGGAITVLNAGGGRDEQWNPTFSPDGSQIAYSVYITETDAQIMVVNVDGTNPVQITASGANRNPAWSPDGSKILYATDDGGIYAINPDGTGATRLADGSAAAWSPDGKYIVYTSYATGNDQLYIMAADGSGQTRIVESAAKDLQPVWGK